jgi:hypothetical protein
MPIRGCRPFRSDQVGRREHREPRGPSTTTLGPSACHDSASAAANVSGVAARAVHGECSGGGKEVRPGPVAGDRQPDKAWQ